MPRILALDYGEKRTGIAETDDLQMIASGLKTVKTPELIDFLTDYCKRENVELLLVGEVKMRDGYAPPVEEKIQEFLETFQSQFDIPVKRVDERLTSKMAFQTMIDSGLSKKKRRNKGLVDEISATIILQTYLY